MTSDSATSEGPRPAGKAPGQESLAPQRTRIMGRLSYLLAWFGGCVSIGTFAMGSSIVGTLNLLQASLAIAIGCFVIGVALTINGAQRRGVLVHRPDHHRRHARLVRRGADQPLGHRRSRR